MPRNPDVAAWRAIPGWFDYAELYDRAVEQLAVAGHPVRFAEVGCFCGKSTIYLALALLQSGAGAGKTAVLEAIDSFDPSNETEQNAMPHRPGGLEYELRANLVHFGCDSLVRIHRSDSADWARHQKPGSLDFAFIDADHRYEAVKRDIEAYLPLIRRGGILAGHDFDEMGVKQAVHDVLGDRAKTMGRCWLVQC